MIKYIIRRLLQLIPTVLLATLFVFLMVNMIRGDAIDIYFGLSESRSPEAEAALAARLGIDKPLPVQYLTWLGRLITGDFGTSWRYDEPVLSLILQRLALSMELAVIASAISIVFSVLLGIYLAVHQNSLADQVIRFVGLIFLSAPIYWVALGIILFLSKAFRWVPPLQYVSLTEDLGTHLQIIAIPSVLWGILSVPSFSRFVRNAVLDVLSEDYVRTARAKGLLERQILYTHVLRNAAGSLITVVGLSLAGAAGGTLLMEIVFTLPGMGRLWLTSIYQRDIPTIMGISVFISTTFVIVNLVVDLCYAWFDPRIRYD
ncbi:MAG: ABC transporter permease [Anaerolineae bacterium]|nr:ABC transporter permease [Anaerolineae bacterium]